MKIEPKFKVVFQGNWGATPAQLLQRFRWQTPQNSGMWGCVQGVEDASEADYCVILEGIPFGLDVGKFGRDRLLCFAQEAAFNERKNYQGHFIKHAFTYGGMHQLGFWRIAKPFYELDALPVPAKTTPLSTITSRLCDLPGHRVRVQFIEEFARRHPDSIHVYGYGWKNELGRSYFGVLGNRHAPEGSEDICKSEGLLPYHYSLAIENCQRQNYFTEKLLDPLLCWTLPIYWGCPNVSEYFPEDSYIPVDVTSFDSIEKIMDIISRPITTRQLEAMKEARKLILHKYNVWPTIERIVRDNEQDKEQEGVTGVANRILFKVVNRLIASKRKFRWVKSIIR